MSGITFASVSSGDYLIAGNATNFLTLTSATINLNYAPTSPQIGPTISAVLGGTVGLNLTSSNSTTGGTLNLSANAYTGNTVISSVVP